MNNRIWVYTICYNEAHFVKHFLYAYKEAEKIIVYDNMSTDNTVSLLLEDKRVVIRQFNTNNQIRDDIYLEIKNHAWKEARGKADWVIVVDFDEIFCKALLVEHRPVFSLDLREAYKLGFNVIRPRGYNMISLDAPLGQSGHPFEYSQLATYHVPEEKMCCFRPDEISEIRYYTGCHHAEPLDKNQGTRDIRICCFDHFKLLHYKFWNLDLYLQRMAEYQTRLSEWNKYMGAGWHYMESLEYHKNLYLNGHKLAKYLFDVHKPE